MVKRDSMVGEVGDLTHWYTDTGLLGDTEVL